MPFQRQAWNAYLAGESGLIQVPTGSGKTYAAVMGPIAEMLAMAPPLASRADDHSHDDKSHDGYSPDGNYSLKAGVQQSVQPVQASGRSPQRTARSTPSNARGLRLLYLTPLRALSRDLALAIQAPIEAMGWPLRVAIRNGDTPSSERTRQLRTPPEILIT
ncbi:MAG: DEAD/DEAH box helicase, partial [Cyanobacteriota bacterium]|nr:DEAD/DEAH box helicase [Cyanobacteriota bacterium]